MKSILMGRKHGKTEWQLIAGPNVTTSDQIILRDEIMRAHPVSDTWADVELWSENRVKGGLKFLTSEQAKDAAAQKIKDDVEISSTRAEAEERQRIRDKQESAVARKRHEEEVAKLNKLHDVSRESFAPTSKAAAKALERLNQPPEKTEVESK